MDAKAGGGSMTDAKAPTPPSCTDRKLTDEALRYGLVDEIS